MKKSKISMESIDRSTRNSNLRSISRYMNYKKNKSENKGLNWLIVFPIFISLLSAIIATWQGIIFYRQLNASERNNVAQSLLFDMRKYCRILQDHPARLVVPEPGDEFELRPAQDPSGFGERAKFESAILASTLDLDGSFVTSRIWLDDQYLNIDAFGFATDVLDFILGSKLEGIQFAKALAVTRIQCASHLKNSISVFKGETPLFEVVGSEEMEAVWDSDHCPQAVFFCEWFPQEHGPYLDSDDDPI